MDDGGRYSQSLEETTPLTARGESGNALSDVDPRAHVRIVFVIPQADMTGGVRVVATYARLLSNRGHKVTVVSSVPPPPTLRSRLKSVLLGRSVPHGISERSHLDDSGVEHRRIRRHRPLGDGDIPDADVVVATWWLTVEWVAALSPRKGVKVHFVQGDDADLPGQPAERIRATWGIPIHRIACSRWIVEMARTKYAVTGVRCVPNGVDSVAFSSPPRDRQARPTVGLLYSPAWIKGCDVALEAFRVAAARTAGLRLVSFGSGPVERDLPVPPGAVFILRPPANAIPRIYASCDVWLWPSRREGFGLPILEAMGCRTPVIAAPAGAAPELLAEGGGILLPAPDAAAMAGAIAEVTSLSSDAWRDLSDQAREVAERHDWESSGLQFEAALTEAFEQGASVRTSR